MANLASKLVGRLDSEKVFKFSQIDPFSEESAWISTFSPYLDYSLKTFGLPTGIIEVRGDSQAGKTTFTLQVIKGHQEGYGERAVTTILSSERRDNKPYAEQLGINTDDITIIRVRTIEDTFNKITQTIDAVEDLIKKGEVKMEGKPRYLFIWDSLGQTISHQEKNALKVRSDAKNKEDETKSAAMGSAARALSLALRGAIGLSDDYDVTLLIVNRPYDNIDGHGKSSYGGKAITFYPNMRFDLVRTKSLEASEEEIGQITVVKPFKTDYANPKQEFEVEIGYGYGFVLTKNDLQFGIDAGILKKFGQNGATFMNGKLKWQTRSELYQLYEDKNPLLKLLTKKLLKIAHDKVLEERK